MNREGGMVTAELAVIAPFGLAFGFLLLWVVSLGLTQVQVADAAREASRVVARGESLDTAERLAERVAPGGASITVDEYDGYVEVTVSVRRGMPLPFFSGVGRRTIASSSTAALEAP